MKLVPTLFALAALALATSLPSFAQAPRVSGSEVTSVVVDGNRVTVAYGRPFSKDPKTGQMRKIWGGLVPYGQVWRTGANEATLLITQQPIELGGTLIPAGAYSLFSLPNEDGSAQLIVNKQIGHWGTQYDQKQDFARVPLSKETLPSSIDQFTIRVERVTGGSTGVIKLMWETTQYSVPFTVKK